MSCTASDDSVRREEGQVQLQGARRRELLPVALVLFSLPWITTYAFPEEWAYTDPKNVSYRHMLLTVYFAFSFSMVTMAMCTKAPPSDSLLAFLICFLCIHVILWAVNEMWAQFVAWLTALILVVVFTRKSVWKLSCWVKDICRFFHKHWHDPMCTKLLILWGVVFTILPFGMYAGPTFAPWERVQAFVRWHPYNTSAELMFRGTFFTFATFLLIASTNPLRHGSIPLYFAWHGLMHGSIMLIDNRRALDGNGNWEHAIEISVFLFIGVLSTLAVLPLLSR